MDNLIILMVIKLPSFFRTCLPQNNRVRKTILIKIATPNLLENKLELRLLLVLLKQCSTTDTEVSTTNTAGANKS